VQAGLARQLDEASHHPCCHGRLSLPVGHIHADLFPAMSSSSTPSLSGVIDFYFAATDLTGLRLEV